MFFGSIPALVTPFVRGRVAEDTLCELIDWQINEGSTALVPCGTTGEVATLTVDEHRRVIELAVEQARGRVPVIAGCGSYSTAASIERMAAAKQVGADAALVVVPYYNKPSQAGIAAHFRALAEASDCRSSSTTCRRARARHLGRDLAECSRYRPSIGVKMRAALPWSPRRARCAPILPAPGQRDRRGFTRWSGSCISVTANVAQELCAECQDRARGPLGRGARAPGRLSFAAALFTRFAGPAKSHCRKSRRLSDESLAADRAVGRSRKASIRAGARGLSTSKPLPPPFARIVVAENRARGTICCEERLEAGIELTGTE